MNDAQYNATLSAMSSSMRDGIAEELEAQRSAIIAWLPFVIVPAFKIAWPYIVRLGEFIAMPIIRRQMRKVLEMNGFEIIDFFKKFAESEGVQLKQ